MAQISQNHRLLPLCWYELPGTFFFFFRPSMRIYRRKVLETFGPGTFFILFQMESSSCNLRTLPLHLVTSPCVTSSSRTTTTRERMRTATGTSKEWTTPGTSPQPGDVWPATSSTTLNMSSLYLLVSCNHIRCGQTFNHLGAMIR